MHTKLFFHSLSYIQYPLMLIGLYFIVSTALVATGNHEDAVTLLLENLNKALIFIGLAVSFSTFQDTSKTQNKVSKRVWESPRKGKIMLALMLILSLLFIAIGLYGLLTKSDSRIKEVSLGIIVLGIGYLGVLKAGIEMFENHRLDKKPLLQDLASDSLGSLEEIIETNGNQNLP